MQLLDAVCSGIRGAEGGHLELYRRGTSTRATWYSDFEATSQNSSGGNIELDSNGAAVVYVNEPVQVIAKDLDGTPVRTFVAGGQATTVEVISGSFTGTHYVTAQRGVHNPVQLSTVLERWMESAGAADWEVLVNGTATSIQDAVQNFGGLLRNVKGPAYGAIGDGVTDDSAAIQAALDAGPGVVYFPPGTYRCNTTLDLPRYVHLFGQSPQNTSLVQNFAVGDLLYVEFTADVDTENVQHIHGLTFTRGAANSDSLIQFEVNRRLNVSSCHFDTSFDLVSTGAAITATGVVTSGALTVRGCSFEGSLASFIESSDQQVMLEVSDCLFTKSVTSMGTATQRCILSLGPGTIRTSRFIYTALAGGSGAAVVGSSNVSVEHCVFEANAANFLSAVSQVGYESGNSFTNCTVVYDISTLTASTPIYLGSRLGRVLNLTITASAQSIDTTLYDTIEITRSDNLNPTYTFSDATPGSMLKLVYINNHSSTLPLSTSGLRSASSGVTATNGTISGIHFVFSATQGWVEVGRAQSI